MRHVELRRHSMRHRPGKHLTQAGVTLARRVGETIGPFDRVITSRLPRAYQTAIAMGYAFDERNPDLNEMGDDVSAETDWPAGFADFARWARQSRTVARFAERQARLLTEIARLLPEGGRALVVGHGGVIELSAVGCLPDADFTSWGPECSYCEGVLLAFDARTDRFTEGRVLRLPAALAAHR
jgi:broad specificity phosphatase PhoE